MSEHSGRKADHLELCADAEVGFRDKSTLFEDVTLIHNALPELHIDDIDLKTNVLGKELQGPLFIAAMTGGTQEAEAINRDLAAVAQELGIGFGFGSMRPLLEDNDARGYAVRDIAPDALILGNLGIVQAAHASTKAIQQMVDRAGCDGLCVHLNPAMELIQAEGDRDFRDGIATLARLHKELSLPIIVKETGCGLSRHVGQRLASLGLQWVDTSGAGGTSWVGVETLRNTPSERSVGQLFWDWGIPSAASVAQLSGLGLNIIATGGVRHGLDIARALALGAVAGGVARPFLKAWSRGGKSAVLDEAQKILHEIRLALLLSGAQTAAVLQSKPVILGDELMKWVPENSPLAMRTTF